MIRSKNILSPTKTNEKLLASSKTGEPKSKPHGMMRMTLDSQKNQGCYRNRDIFKNKIYAAYRKNTYQKRQVFLEAMNGASTAFRAFRDKDLGFSGEISETIMQTQCDEDVESDDELIEYTTQRCCNELFKEIKRKQDLKYQDAAELASVQKADSQAQSNQGTTKTEEKTGEIVQTSSGLPEESALLSSILKESIAEKTRQPNRSIYQTKQTNQRHLQNETWDDQRSSNDAQPTSFAFELRENWNSNIDLKVNVTVVFENSQSSRERLQNNKGKK